MKLPYGISDFGALREQGYLYVDKTSYIERLEGLSSKYIFFIRPRRFGKSLFLSVLEHYYSINKKDGFDELFGGLYIGKNPTPLRNSYLVLRLNFSGLDTLNKGELEKSFKRCLKSSFSDFFDRYSDYFEDVAMLKSERHYETDVRAIFDLLIGAVRKTGKKLYLIIDEYDNFANDIIAVGDSELYKDIVRGSGFVREFYKAVKIGTESVIDRIFITGSSPVMLDDLTSGFNIAKNLTTNVALNEMLGFTEGETRQIIDFVNIDKDRQELLNELRDYYNGYLFNTNGRERLYNPDMVLHFFTEWQISGYYPTQLVDHNVKTDYGKLERLINNDKNREVLEEIIKKEFIEADIETEFSFDRMYDNEYFVSLLFYMGMLTIDRQEKTKLLLKMPNYVIKTIYWEFVEKRLRHEYNIIPEMRELRTAIEEMAYEGRIKPYLEYISVNVLNQLSNRDLIGFDEKYIKVLLFSYLVNSRAYRPVSEMEVENGYIDIYLMRDKRMPDVKYEWIIELKYLKESERYKFEQVRQEGLDQLKKYVSSRGMMGKGDVKSALVVFMGKGDYKVDEIS